MRLIDERLVRIIFSRIRVVNLELELTAAEFEEVARLQEQLDGEITRGTILGQDLLESKLDLETDVTVGLGGCMALLLAFVIRHCNDRGRELVGAVEKRL